MGWGISKFDFKDPASLPNTKNKMAGSVKLVMPRSTHQSKISWSHDFLRL
jgi:hypothetical protein